MRVCMKFSVAILLVLFITGTEVRANDYSGYEIFSFELTAEESGYYFLNINYAAIPGAGNILASLRINGTEISEIVSLHRFFADQDRGFLTQSGNQMFPTQTEIQRFTDRIFSLSPSRPLQFWLEAGVNSFEIIMIEGAVVLGDEPQIIPAVPLVSYAEYSANHANTARYNGEMLVIQAQLADFKTSRALRPENDRTCPLVTPYHHTYIVLNTIGGWSWRVPGQRIEWNVNVPESGMYRISLRYTQREKRGFTSRALTINGEVPFREAAYLQFDFNNSFDSRFLGNPDTGEDFWFFLEAGDNLIGLEAVLGVFDTILEQTVETLLNLNSVYQDIIMITSARPDRFRDYMILASLPDLRERLRAESDSISDIMQQIEDAGAAFAESTSILDRLQRNINRLADRPDLVAELLVDFQSSIAALSNFVTMAQEQPLRIDVIGIGGSDDELFQARAGFFARLWHRILAFVGSFWNDFNTLVEENDDTERVTIEVWISTGFDIFNILGRTINEMFVASHPHINVDLRLVDGGIVFPASLTGQGPDVVLQVAAATPINFAHRGGAIDLSQFADFDEVASRFSPAALETFTFQNRVYALPDQMTFNVLFYRTDIFEELGLEAPDTMDDFLGIVPILQARHMDIFFTTAPQPILGTQGGVGATTRGLNPVHVSLLHQMGGSVYNDSGSRTEIASEIGIEAFRYWTNLYTRHNFIVETDPFTRFRMGTIPVLVADLGLFNMFNAAAPEIRGNWAIAPIPGWVRDDGEFRRDNVMTVSGNFIVGNTVERKGTAQEAWEFLRWFTSTEVQERFAQDAESVWGHNWRYQTANLEAFERLN